MSKQTINIGASPNDGTGTPLRTSFDYTNQNFTEIYTALGGGVALPGATTQVIFNDGGTNLAGDAGLVYNKTTDALTVAGLVTAGSATITGAATVGTTLGVTGQSTLTGNVGVGATPSAWNSSYKAIDFGENGTIAGRTGSSNTVDIASNGFRNTSGNWVYKLATSNTACRYQLDGSAGEHIWFSGVAGTAGNTIPGFTTAAMTLNASGNLVFPTGKGIDFSATANSSGTMTSELLNDYEEGTWTGTITGSTTNPTVPVTATGRYTKIGRVVTVQIFYSNVSTVGASGNIAITGLPFTNSTIQSVGVVSLYQIGTFTGSTFAIIDSSSSSTEFISNISGSIYGNVTHNAGIARYMTTSITYTVA